MVSHSTTPITPRPSPGAKWQYPSPNWAVSPSQLEDAVGGVPEEPPHLRQRDETPLYKSLMGNWWEALANDSDLVWKAREDYFKKNHPHFDHETS